jgi:hypothetical protein
MCCFIVKPPLDSGFEMDLEEDAVDWRSDIDLVDALRTCWRILKAAHGN